MNDREMVALSIWQDLDHMAAAAGWTRDGTMPFDAAEQREHLADWRMALALFDAALRACIERVIRPDHSFLQRDVEAVLGQWLQAHPKVFHEMALHDFLDAERRAGVQVQPDGWVPEWDGNE